MFGHYKNRQKHYEIVKQILWQDYKVDNELNPNFISLSDYKSIVDEAVRDEINDEEVALKVVTRYCVNLAANGHIQDAKQLAPRVLFAAEYFLDRGLISKNLELREYRAIKLCSAYQRLNTTYWPARSFLAVEVVQA